MVSRKFLVSTNLMALLLAGCSAKYQCETAKVGVCASVEDTYEALYSSEPTQGGVTDSSAKEESGVGAVTFKPQPVMPIREPERVYRIWVRDYEDENGYYISNHFIYVSVGGKWLLKPVRERTLGSTEDYDMKIKNYLMKKGVIKLPEEEEEDEDEFDI